MGGAPPLPPPTTALPDTQGTDSPLELGTATFSTPGPTLQNLQTLAMPGTFLLMAPTGLGHMPWVTPQSLGPLGQPEPPSSKMLPSPGLLSTPAQDSPANSSRAPGPLDPSPVEEGFPVDLLPARNASWEVGNWSQASAAGVRAGRCVCRVGGVLTESRQSRVCPAFWGVRAQELTACGGWSLCG